MEIEDILIDYSVIGKVLEKFIVTKVIWYVSTLHFTLDVTLELEFSFDILR